WRGPDPARGRVPRVQPPVRDDREDGRGAQAGRSAGVRGVPAGGRQGPDQAGPQDERAAGAQGDGAVPGAGAHQDGRHPPVATRHHLHQEGGEVTTTAERDALLDAVFAHPDDDTPRLIYADWLDEHGEGVHAEFIRRQIELERFNGRPTARAAVKNREVAAWRRYDRWLSGRFPGMVFSKEYFERGFHKGRGGEQYITPTEFLTHSDRWWPWLPVRWVRMHAQDQYPDELLESGHLPRLRR